MIASTITRRRLYNQQLARHDFGDPQSVVSWLGAVQGQDYAGAKWALGLRLPSADDAGIEQALTGGEIIRTHVMRPTWHFVAPADLRWMLHLTAPRVKALLAYYERQLELDAGTLRAGARVVERALRGGIHLTRFELTKMLAAAGITGTGQRIGHILVHAELDALICSGPRRGKQLTYALLEERVPPAPRLTRDEALIALARRYFTSHGPAQLKDFAWWSGLTVKDTRTAVDALQSELVVETADGKHYWSVPRALPRRQSKTVAYLLPNYDEYGIAYKDRSDFLVAADHAANVYRDRGYPHLFVIDGEGRGMWRREIERDIVIVTLRPFGLLNQREQQALERAAAAYAAFLRAPVSLRYAG